MGHGRGSGSGGGRGRGDGGGAGAQDLLRLLRPITKQVIVENEAKGKSIAIDGFGWLHALAATHAHEFVINGNAKPIIDEFLDRLRSLNNFGIVCITVLDGDPLRAP